MILQIGVKIFLKNPEGKYLLVKRSSSKYGKVDGEWDIVGGRIDPGTGLMENLKREVREETQLEIIGEPRLIAAQDIIPNAEKHVVRLSYVGETEGNPILDTEENTEYRWITLSEMQNAENIDAYACKLVEAGLLEA